MTTTVKILSIAAAQYGHYRTAVEFGSDAVGAFGAEIEVDADSFSQVPEVLRKKLLQFGEELTKACGEGQSIG